jgi:hypothetical protein
MCGQGDVRRKEPRLGAPNLRVDYTLLEASHKSLTSLASEFGTLQASTSGYDAAMGSGAIAGAMGNFAGNWSYHRDKLVANMHKLDEMITESVKQFMNTDHRLAREFQGGKK